MVYTGKPSKACERCRQRRMRCDQARPQCRKCQAAKVTCPGYRDEQDMLFRNVTQEVITRAKGSAKLPRRESPRPQLGIQDGTLEVALTFLFKVYLRRSSFEWAEGLYREVAKDSIFAQVVHTTALAAFSQESHRIKLLAKARDTYNDALLRLREYITEPIEDATLASVLLMSRFETLLMDGNVTTVTENWTRHIFGAFSIVESRTDEQNFGRPLSLLLTEQTCHNYNIYCLQRKEPRRKALIVLTQKLLNVEKSSFRSIRFLMHDFCEAFVQCRKALRAKEPDAVRNARELDARLHEFEKNLTESCPFELVAAPSMGLEPHADIVHIYKSQLEARTWNNLRLIRLTIHYDLVTSEGEQSESRAMINRACAEICASAPQFLSDSDDCTHSAASYLAWPLFVAGRVSFSCTRFAKDALLWIGRELNMKTADLAARTMADPSDYNDDGLLACYMF